MAYEPPAATRSLAVTERIVQLPPSNVLSELHEQLETAAEYLVEQSVERRGKPDVLFLQTDRAANRIIVTYVGSPKPFVECGHIAWPPGVSQSRQEWVPAAEGSLESDVPFSRYSARFERVMRLDARVVLSVELEGSASRVATDASYVVTKAVKIFDDGGDVQAIEVETINFEPSEIGHFARGTECRATGMLERLALGTLQPTDGWMDALASSPSGRL